jgi:hypothetical protein
MNSEVNATTMNKDEPEISIDDILENENIRSKSESWNKLNKTLKIQKLHVFSEKYGKDHKYSAKEIKQLKHFFSDALEKNKLQKAKDVVYDKQTQNIIDIPNLYFHPSTKSFTLRADTKRQSTLKSLTPKRSTEKAKTNVDDKSI